MTNASAADRMAMARSAQRHWESRSVNERCGALRVLRYTIANRLDEVVAVICSETGKPPLDALGGDLMVTLEQMRYYERHAHRILAPRHVGKPPFFFSGTRFTEHHEAYGVALIFAPWNYPFQLSVIPAITALFAGNSVLLKCSERVPRTTAMIETLCRKAALPAGLVQISCEPPDEASALIDARPDLIFFTGSSQNGQRVAERAASYLIPTMLELGGKDACIVFSGCDLQRTVNAAVYGAFSNAGQVCVGIKRIYVERSIYQSFLSIFLERAQRLGIGETDGSDFGPIRFDPVRQLLSDQVKDAVARGATLHTSWADESKTVPPIVLTHVPVGARILNEESFGPVVCVIPFQNEDEALRLANSSPFSLSASVFTGDGKQARRVAAKLNAGSCAINDVIRNIANPQASFGGNGTSGYGRYHGPSGLRSFSRIKSVMTNRRLRNPEIHWFPFTSRTFALTRGLLLARHAGGTVLRRFRHLRVRP
jgi:acyl-CoA reductase-like NAD-dependent aldehyde dehydrogenase